MRKGGKQVGGVRREQLCVRCHNETDSLYVSLESLISKRQTTKDF